MANPYDRFDEQATAPAQQPADANPYDRFDVKRKPGLIEEVLSTIGRSAAGAAQGAYDWARESVQGPGDLPDLPEFDAPSPTGEGTAKAAFGLMMSNNPAAQADILRQHYPGIKITPVQSDEAGSEYMIADWTDPEGQRHVGYVNAPGLTGRDVTATVGQGLSYVPAARLGRGASVLTGAAKGQAPGLVSRMARTGAGTAASRAGLDVAAGQTGSRQGIDPLEVAATGIAGAGAEAAAPAVTGIYRLLRGNPLWSGQGLSGQGQKLAQQAGLDAPSMSGRAQAEFARIARTGDLDAAANAARSVEFDIPTSRGQVTRDYRQLNLEERMRRGLEGDEPAAVMKQFEESQAAGVERGAQRVQKRLQPRPSEDLPETQSRFLRGFRARERELDRAVDEAYNKVRKLDEARIETTDFEGLIGRFDDALSQQGRVVDQDLTPGTVYALRQLRERLKPTDDGTIDLQDFELARRVLGRTMNAAKTPEDKSNIRVLRKQLDGWLDDAVDEGLMRGGPGAVEALKKARAARAEYGRFFEKRDRNDTAGAIVDRILNKAETPEMAMNYVLGHGELGRRAEAVGAVRRLKDILGAESDAWNALREAAWNRIARDSQGRPRSAEAFRKAWTSFVTQNSSLRKELFTPEETSLMRRYGQALKTTDRPPTNPSSTAFALEDALRYTLRRFGQRESFTKGNVGTGTLLNFMARMPLNPLGASDWAKRIQASRAIAPVSGRVPPSAAPVAGMTAGAEQQQAR